MFKIETERSRSPLVYETFLGLGMREGGEARGARACVNFRIPMSVSKWSARMSEVVCISLGVGGSGSRLGKALWDGPVSNHRRIRGLWT